MKIRTTSEAASNLISESRGDHRHTRFTSHAKTDAVLRLLKGESSEAISQQLGTTPARIERWKSRFVAAGSAELAKRNEGPSRGWLAKHANTLRQWTWLLVALVVVVSILVLLLQHGPEG